MMMELISKLTVLLLMFLFGLQCLKVGLFQLSYQRTKQWIQHFSRNPILAILTGFAATGLLQSSSVVIVLAMGLVTTKYMKVTQAIGIMLGANLGTTLTGEILSLSLHLPYSFLLLAGGLMIVMQHQKTFAWGTILFGLAVIFLALENLGGSIADFMNLPGTSDWLSSLDDSTLSALFFGIIGSGLIQSSSAMFGVTLTMLEQGAISMPSAIAVILGTNIGTCITASIAGAALDKGARVVASSHIWYNLISVLLFLPVLGYLDELSVWLAAEPGRQLAHLAVLFNTVTIFLFYPFLKPFEKWLTRLHK
ncbi:MULTISPECIES: Na/Pi symporter [Thalassobacillus]|uniref:Na/Pi symporter n=1 Tax=Thalassobacillus TaxID=331971 RepID=UPI00159379A4|nr:Na/Pi symporter [Thalassobacillus devorans]